MRRDATTFALARDGKRIAVGDGPELLVYQQNGQPVWKHFCEGILVGLGFAGEHLGTVDADGRVVFYRAADGLRIEEVLIQGPVLGVFTSPDGAFGVVTRGGPVVVAANGQHGGYPVLDLECAAFGPDRGSLGLGTRSGSFISMDGNTGAPWGTLDLGAPIVSIAWCAQGYWLVLVERVLFRIDGSGTQILGRKDLDGPASQVTCTSDGAIAAVLVHGEPPEVRVAILELVGHVHAGDVLFRRPVGGIAFGPVALLGVGLDDGDASTIDLITRANLRTEPHPGRGRNNWNLDMKFEAGPLRGAVTTLRAGGQAIATYQGPPDEAESDGGGGNAGCKIAIVLAILLFFALTSCLTFAFVLRWFDYL